MLSIVEILAVILENSRPNRNKKWRIIEGKFVSKSNENVSIAVENGVRFGIRYKNEEPWILGDLTRVKGQWLEDLAAYMIHHFWQSEYSIFSLKTLPLKVTSRQAKKMRLITTQSPNTASLLVKQRLFLSKYSIKNWKKHWANSWVRLPCLAIGEGKFHSLS